MAVFPTRGVGSSACHSRSGRCAHDSTFRQQLARPARDLRQRTNALSKLHPHSATEMSEGISVSQRTCSLERGSYGPALCSCLRRRYSISRRTKAPSNAAFFDRWLGRGGTTEPAAAASVLAELSQQGLGAGVSSQQSPSGAPPAPLLSGAGGGIFFFHQLGALNNIPSFSRLSRERLKPQFCARGRIPEVSTSSQI